MALGRHECFALTDFRVFVQGNQKNGPEDCSGPVVLSGLPDCHRQAEWEVAVPIRRRGKNLEIESGSPRQIVIV